MDIGKHSVLRIVAPVYTKFEELELETFKGEEGFALLDVESMDSGIVTPEGLRDDLAANLTGVSVSR